MDHLFGLDGVSRHDDGVELLTTVYDHTLLAVYESILRDAKIPYMIKERGSGSAVKVITGFSMFGTDIFVRADQWELATALITPSEEALEEIEESEETEKTEESEESDI